MAFRLSRVGRDCFTDVGAYFQAWLIANTRDGIVCTGRNSTEFGRNGSNKYGAFLQLPNWFDRKVGDMAMSGTNKKKTSDRFVILALGLMFILGIPTQTSAQSTEQLRMLEQLSLADRQALLEVLEGANVVRQQPISSPEPEPVRLVGPRTAREENLYKGTGQDDSGDRGVGIPSAGDLRPFGYDLFAGDPSTFAPATDIPVPVDYTIGPGDTVEIQLFGGQNALYSLVVSRDGVLNFPEIGPIPVVGLKFDDLRETLQQRIGEQMIGVKAAVSMGRLRSIRVFILGDAHKPGSYTVSSLSTMTNALLVSGGISRIGSLRNIQLKRNGRVVQTLDLYDLLLRGDTSNDARLQPGDVIFIPPVGRTAGIGGEVRRPAIYELGPQTSVADLIELTGGLLPTAYAPASQIERISEDRERIVVDVDLSTAAGLSLGLKDDDRVRIYSVLQKREDVVALRGHVYREGMYQWHQGMRLSDLIASEAALQPKADMKYVLIRREFPSRQGIEVVSTDLAKALATPGGSADVLLQSRDQVHVFDSSVERSAWKDVLVRELERQASLSKPAQVVSVDGRVRWPGHYPLENNMRVSQLLRAGGDLGEAAYALDAELTRFEVTEGELRQTHLLNIDIRRVLDGDAVSDLELQPHDVLNIKEVPMWHELETIQVEGEVRFPGKYTIRRGEHLSSVLRRAGGLTDLGYAGGAVFLREELRLRERELLDDLFGRLENQLVLAGDGAIVDDDVQDSRQSLLRQLEEAEATGRLVIDLQSILAGDNGGNADVILSGGDRLLVPRKLQTVSVVGEVQYPTSHIWQDDLTRRDYIDRSGGPTPESDKRRIYIVRADGSVVPPGKWRRFGANRRTQIVPGDTIVVPLDADRVSKLSLWTNVTTILYNIGVAAAAVASF